MILAGVTLLVGFVGSGAKAADMPYQESLRPGFHFTAAKNWLNDPNGLVYCEGVYHLFFQYNPYGIESAHKSWGHAVSGDLVHWTQRDVALWPDQLGDIWSGSAVVDVENTSGFQTARGGGAKPIVLTYTAAGGVSKESQGRKFTQCLAFSSDGGQTWTKYDKNPVLDHIRGDNRDPKVIWHAPSKRWIMALYLDKSDFGLFGSPDLKRWEHLQDLTVSGMAECPDFFEMPVEGEPGKSAWIFTAANAKYLVGRFDGKQFQPDGGAGGGAGFTPIQSEFNDSFYAGQTFSNVPDGRRIQIAWLRDGKYPGMPFNQQLSFPTVLTLHRTPDGLRLRRHPIDQIKSLHDLKVTRANVSLSNNEEEVKELAGDLLDVNAVLQVQSAKRVGLRVRGQTIVFDDTAKTLKCLNAAAPLTPVDGRITVRVLIDRTSIEVFANGGALSLSGCYLPDQNKQPSAPAFFAEDGTAELISCEGYTLKSAWDGASPHGLEKHR